MSCKIDLDGVNNAARITVFLKDLQFSEIISEKSWPAQLRNVSKFVEGFQTKSDP